MLLPRPQCFFACKVNTLCMKESVLSLAKVLAQKVLTDDSNIFAEPDVHATVSI